MSDDEEFEDRNTMDILGPSDEPTQDGPGPDPSRELDSIFDDLEMLLKNGDVIGALTVKGVNASLALVAIDALRAYLKGEKLAAARDFADVADEIKGRLAQGRE